MSGETTNFYGKDKIPGNVIFGNPPLFANSYFVDGHFCQ